MRVIAGIARGMKIKAPRGEAVRPTADRVRKALFSILSPRVIGAVVVDLFAGSGAVGIEALSRGAEACFFVDNEQKHLEIVRDNLKRTGLDGQARLLCRDAISALLHFSGEKLQADLIFADPPYHSDLIPKVLQAVYTHQLLQKEGLLVIEHASGNTGWAEEYPQRKQKKYGDTRLTLLSWKDLQTAAAEKENEANGTNNIEHGGCGGQKAAEED